MPSAASGSSSNGNGVDPFAFFDPEYGMNLDIPSAPYIHPPSAGMLMNGQGREGQEYGVYEDGHRNKRIKGQEQHATHRQGAHLGYDAANHATTSRSPHVPTPDPSQAYLNHNHLSTAYLKALAASNGSHRHASGSRTPAGSSMQTHHQQGEELVNGNGYSQSPGTAYELAVANAVAGNIRGGFGQGNGNGNGGKMHAVSDEQGNMTRKPLSGYPAVSEDNSRFIASIQLYPPTTPPLKSPFLP